MDTPPSGIPSEDPLAPNEIEWLLDGLANPSTDVQTAALGAIVTLPLSVDAWLAVGDALAPHLHAKADPELLAAAMQVPLRRIREKLPSMVDEVADPDRLVTELAHARDPDVVPYLVEVFRGDDAYRREWALEHLSWFALPELRDELMLAATSAETMEERLWASIGLCQVDEPDALEQLLADPDQIEAMYMFWGDPMEAFGRVAGRGPWPQSTQASLERLAIAAQDRQRSADVIIEALLAGTDQRGEGGPVVGPSEEDDPDIVARKVEQAQLVRSFLEQGFLSTADPGWDRMADLRGNTGRWDVLAYLPPTDATKLVTTLWRRLADMYRDMQSAATTDLDPWMVVNGGNDLGSMVHDMGKTFVPDVASLYHCFVKIQGDSQLTDQLGWTTARSGLRNVVTELGSLAVTTDDQEAITATALVKAAGGRVDDDWPPIYGGAPTPAGSRQISYFVDDMMTGSAPPETADDLDTSDSDEVPDEAVEVAKSESGDDTAVNDPPRTAFGHVQCPDVVEMGRPFDLEIGIAAKLDPRVGGTQIQRPSWSQGTYVLTIQLIAEGFTLGDGESSRIDVAVTSDVPYPRKTLHLTPLPQTEPVVSRMIQASYYIGSEHVGIAYRPISVVRDLQEGNEARPAPLILGAAIGQPPGGQAAPDVTAEIALGEAPGSLHWTIRTAPSLGLQDPPAPITMVTEPRVAPEEFVRQLIDLMNQETELLGNRVLGVGSLIAESIPFDFWKTLGQVAVKVQPDRPRVSLVSHDDFIPWELALMETPIDPGSPPLLGAQVTLGRWILPRPNRDKPASPPIAHQSASSMAVICGKYGQGIAWPRLEHAEAEATDLVSRYQATDIPASAKAIKAYLNGTPRTRILHFAGHAHFDPVTVQAHGLVLDDETYLHPLDVRGKQLPSRPFVFLNACQAAAGYQMLGSCAGMVSGFVYAGASGVVAPIWSVNDKVAQEIARDFYRQVLEEDVPPAEAMRRLRAQFGRDDQGNEVDPTSAICLAYQFFGHPNLVLDRDSPDLEIDHA